MTPWPAFIIGTLAGGFCVMCFMLSEVGLKNRKIKNLEALRHKENCEFRQAIYWKDVAIEGLRQKENRPLGGNRKGR